MILLQVSGVSKRYGKTLANDSISLRADPGKVTVMLGPNGAGKSTLIKCIAGLLRFEGEVIIGGHAGKSLEAKRLLGYVPEMPAVYDLLTVREHLEFIRRAYRIPLDPAKDQARLERFELWEHKDKLGREL
jgi:ABC-type multidrug transport system ATPase subunit